MPVGGADLFNVHFGAAPPVLSAITVSGENGVDWVSEKTALKGFGRSVKIRPKKEEVLSVVEDQSPKTRVSFIPLT